MTNTLPTIESFGVSKEMDATLEVVDEVIERAGAENASRVAGMIAHVTSLTLGEKIDALGVADDRVEFSDVQLL